MQKHKYDSNETIRRIQEYAEAHGFKASAFASPDFFADTRYALDKNDNFLIDKSKAKDEIFFTSEEAIKAIDGFVAGAPNYELKTWLHVKHETWY